MASLTSVSKSMAAEHTPRHRALVTRNTSAGLARRSLALGGQLRLGLHALGEPGASRLAIPLLEGLGRDLTLDEELGELAALSLTLEGHRQPLRRLWLRGRAWATAAAGSPPARRGGCQAAPRRRRRRRGW